jgi:hypothetical protein
VLLKGVRGSRSKAIEPVSLTAELTAVEQAISDTPGCQLLIVDPISAYMNGVDTHTNSDVRGTLAPLVELAGRLDVALVGVTHLNKGEQKALYRTTGSLAFVAAARTVWAVAADPDDSQRLLFLPVKNNLAADSGGLEFRREVVGETVRVKWGGRVNTALDDVLARPDRERQGAVESAVTWLQEELAGGPKPSREVMAAAECAGHSWQTVRRASDRLGIQKRLTAFQGGWIWELPGPRVGQTPVPHELNNSGKSREFCGSGPELVKRRETGHSATPEPEFDVANRQFDEAADVECAA